LTSYAQLGAIRLGAERAFISLFDRTHQHVLAEATPTLSLIGGRVASEPERLRLGCCVFSKERGICHYVESRTRREQRKDDTDVNDSTLVVLDMNQDERLQSFKWPSTLSDVQFYVAVPIISPRGFSIGALSVMDSKARSSSPDQHSLQFMKDMAATVMDHLAMKETTRRSRRAERMIVGLGSFVEGKSSLRDSWHEAHEQDAASEKSGEYTEGQLNIEQQDIQQELAKETGQKNRAIRNLAIREPSEKAESAPISRHPSPPSPSYKAQRSSQQTGIEFSQENGSVRAVLTGKSLKDDTLPNSIRSTFSRAANLLRESIGAEGVMFLDANSERFGAFVNQNKRRVSGSGSEGSTPSSDEHTGSDSSRRQNSDSDFDSDPDQPSVSECLGFSSSTVSSINDEEKAGQAIVVPEPLFTSLLRRYPRGKIFTYNTHGSVSEGSDSQSQNASVSECERTSSTKEYHSSSKGRRKPGSKKHADDLIKIFAGARNILLLPIWDPDRSRWFAGTIIWTNEPERIFTFENELVYTSAFTNSIMAEIRRVDVKVAEKTKTNLVSSITHELRNPLHGILGTSDILSDTAMNALQHGMVHTIESCGRTLLDTINSLLDLTFIDQYRKGDTSQKGKRKKKPGLPGTSRPGDKSSFSNVQLGAVLEEVTECVFAGYCFYSHPQAPPPALKDSSSRSAGQANKADQAGPRASLVTVIFDIEPDTEWDFYTHAGAWRRILMNVFGNALKYTSSGYIYVELKSSQGTAGSSHRSSRKQRSDFMVTITVKDTGKGIGPEYLQHDLFSPFKQEDPHSPGSGLGLSIVRKAVELLGGSIEIESTQGVGTQLSIHTPLTRSSSRPASPSSESMHSSIRKYTEGKTIGILGFGQALRSQRDTILYSSLERMCRDWLGLQVTKLSPLEDKHVPFDFYLAVQTELDCEDVGERNLFGLPEPLDTGTSPVVVICQSPEEAHRMFVASQSRGQTTFEFVSQPCGPRKLAQALGMCMKRQRDQEDSGSTDGPTRWVEMPESSHLPVDVAATDPPGDRMKIRKRPTAETMGSTENRSQLQYPKQPRAEHPEADQKDASRPASSPEQKEGAPEIQKPHVLLVDDNDLNLQLLCAYVQKDGFEYMSAKNGAQAVDLYKAHPGKFQIVIIGAFIISPFLPLLPDHVHRLFLVIDKLITPDLSMPVMDGFEASRQIRRLEKEHRAGMSETEKLAHPPTLIAALTGLDSANAQKEALGSGVNTFLVKPVKRPELQTILQRKV